MKPVFPFGIFEMMTLLK